MPQNPLPNHGLSGATSVAEDGFSLPGASFNLDAALARLGGDRELLAALIEIFLEDGPALLKRVKSAYLSDDRPALHHTAHHLRGLASNFDARDVTEPALLIEKLAASNTNGHADAGIVLEQLETAVVKLTEDLRNFRP
jgi:HPt (histidine-containing phosphotransfer) domain-containing protein